ncbi:MAG: aminotransferase class V-fold PLP-dependent enzyme [Anaerolineales bacterium]
MNDLSKYFLLDPNVVFLNHGSFGATPEPVFRAYQHWQRELESQPVEFLGRRAPALLAESRLALARFLGASADDLVYVINATTGINIVARSLELGPGDEVLTTNHEYGACDRTWRFLAKKRGFAYVTRSVPLSDDFVENLWAGVTARTKIIFLSHITSPTAAIFPVHEVCLRAREQGILTVVDGAHAPGQIPLALDDLGVDFYTGNLHKWLCAPKGSAFLYAHKDVQHLLEPLVVSWGYEAEQPGPSQFVDHHEMWGTRDISAFLSVPAAIQFQEEQAWDEVRRACHAKVRDAEARIRQLTGFASLYPSDSWYAQMATVRLPDDVDIDSFKETLYEVFHVEIPLLEWDDKQWMRISVQGYNTQADLDALLAAIKKLL